MSTFQPADNLRSRTFIGLLIAQFLAAFNDQAIHASAMFFAIHQQTLREDQAISLMPILFYAPWAIFCTVAGYLADRYSKRSSLVFWKFAEVGICLIALAGFWLGTHGDPNGPLNSRIGPWLVLSTVFLMGMHSAFFVPAKYGAMPEILTGRMLSRGNGVLESLSFLAVILGTVVGGVLSYYFHGQEAVIGLILLALAVLGAAASLFIRRMPAANPGRPFPELVYQPLFENIWLLLRSRPLALAVVGIAFFTFIVAFMRATVYMHGESQVERWTEMKTSLVVGMVALGIGLGSPLVGFLSGGKVELGLVPIGAVGMILAAVLAAVTVGYLPGLIACIVCIGFFTGFYIVPLFTLLQHRAPKTSKGDSIATSNFINVTGAIIASVLFYALTWVAHHTSVAPPIPQTLVAEGRLAKLVPNEFHTRYRYLKVEREGGRPFRLGKPGSDAEDTDSFWVEWLSGADHARLIEIDEDLIDVRGGLKVGDEVAVSKYTRVDRAGRRFTYYRVRAADRPEAVVYENERLPGLLFLGAGFMTLVTLLILWWQLPDLLTRTFLWFRIHRNYRLEIGGMHHLPDHGPVLLVSDAPGADATLHVLSATDRCSRFLVVQGAGEPRLPAWLRRLIRLRHLGLIEGRNAGAPSTWQEAGRRAREALARGEVVGLSVGAGHAAEVERLLAELSAAHPAPLLPVHYAVVPRHHKQRVYLLAGPALPAGSSVEAVRGELERLRDEFRGHERSGLPLGHALAAH